MVTKIPERRSRRDTLRLLGAGGVAAMAAASTGRGVAGGESAPLPKVVLEWFGAWSSDDPPHNLAALYAADGSYEDVAAGASILGPEIESYLRRSLAGLTGILRYPRTTFAVDGLAVAEQLFVATSTASVPGGRAGAQFQVYAATIFTFDDERTLHRSTDYYDSASILRQLGALPDATPARRTRQELAFASRG